MGFMNINHWTESDNAAGFAHTLEQSFKRCKTVGGWRTCVRKHINAEMVETDNSYNTPGWLNVAMVLDAEGECGKYHSIPLISKYLTVRQYDLLLGYFDRETPDFAKSFHPRLAQLRRMIVNCRRRSLRKGDKS